MKMDLLLLMDVVTSVILFGAAIFIVVISVKLLLDMALDKARHEGWKQGAAEIKEIVDRVFHEQELKDKAKVEVLNELLDKQPKVSGDIKKPAPKVVKK